MGGLYLTLPFFYITLNKIWIQLIQIFDLLYLEIFIQMNTQYYDKGKLISDRRTILAKYGLRTKFNKFITKS